MDVLVYTYLQGLPSVVDVNQNGYQLREKELPLLSLEMIDARVQITPARLPEAGKSLILRASKTSRIGRVSMT